MKEIEVKLTYFKESGKYYSEGKFQFPKNKSMYEIFNWVKAMLDQGIRPGLINGKSGFHVLVEAPKHPNNCPHLFLNKG